MCDCSCICSWFSKPAPVQQQVVQFVQEDSKSQPGANQSRNSSMSVAHSPGSVVHNPGAPTMPTRTVTEGQQTHAQKMIVKLQAEIAKAAQQQKPFILFDLRDKEVFAYAQKNDRVSAIDEVAVNGVYALTIKVNTPVMVMGEP